MARLADVVADIVARRGEEGARQLPAIALSATLAPGNDGSDPQTLTRAVATIEPVVHPDLEALLDASGALRRGRASWAFGLGEHCDPTALRLVLDHVRPGLVTSKASAATTRGPKDLSELYGYHRSNALSNGIVGSAASGVLSGERRTRHGVQWPSNRYGYGIVTVSHDGRTMWISVHTHFLDVDDDGDVPAIPLNLWAAGRSRVDARPQITAEAVAVADWARAQELDVICDDNFAAAERTAARTVAVWPRRGRPAEATASVGRFVPNDVKVALGAGATAGYRCARIVDVDSVSVSNALTGESTSGVATSVADVAAMEGASPAHVDGAKSYQNDIIGTHLATRVGYVNALPTGMGKTVTTLGAFRLRAQEKPRWRGLVIVEANVRAQWTEQASTWFPEAEIVTVTSRADDEKLVDALTSAGDQPVLVICSYSLAADAAEAADPHEPREAAIDAVLSLRGRSKPGEGQMALFDVDDSDHQWSSTVADADCTGLGSTLLSVFWDDIAADEALGLRNTGTKLASALWRLRDRSEVAVALTGTPITKGLDDLGRLLAWSRGDADLFRGCRLEKTFDLSDDDALRAYHRAIGPLVVWRDKSELDGELPELSSEVVLLEPTRSEKALATAARKELKRVYDELVAWMEYAEGTREGADADAIAAAREALTTARGAWLGGTTLARMAASDPEALLGSNSAGAALLASQGLIAEAIDDGGTKRTWCVEYCRSRAARGERVVVFTDFATVARSLITDLRDAGVTTSAALGGGGASRDRDIAAFVAGDTSVLVATSAVERGQNLQVADALIHYDLPWTHDRVLQRTGRVMRIGGTTAKVDLVFPIMSGTIEERVSATVVARAMTSIRAFAVDGVSAADSELGRVLGNLAVNVNEDAVEGNQASMLAITRDILAV